jgi:hypothetical protein
LEGTGSYDFYSISAFTFVKKRIVGVLNHFIVVYPQLLELFITTCLFQTRTLFPSHIATKPLCGDGDLDLNTGLDVDDDLLDDLGGSVEIDETCSARLARIPALAVACTYACGCASRRCPRSWNPHRKGSCGW